MLEVWTKVRYTLAVDLLNILIQTQPANKQDEILGRMLICILEFNYNASFKFYAYQLSHWRDRKKKKFIDSLTFFSTLLEDL